MDERWAQYWVNKYRWALDQRGDIDQDDLMQAARMGAWRAEQTYKPEMGSWATYSAYWIRQEIRQALGMKNGRLPPAEIHLDEPLTDDTGDTRLDMLADDSIPDIDEALTAEDLRQGVHRAVERLGDGQREVVTRRFFRGQSAAQAAQEMQTTPARICKLWDNAKRRLRRDRLLKELAGVQARYYIHVGADQFNTTHTSAVEMAVLIMERERDKITRQIARGETE